MPINFGVVSDGNCIVITDNVNVVNIETIPKEKVVLQIVLAGEGQNKSGIDELWIQHDGKYSVEIPYTDVHVASAGVAPVSVEAFRVAVLALLNDSAAYPLGGAKIICGHLTQTGTDAPVNVTIFNNSGITITPSYTGVGVYSLGNSVAFNVAKTFYVLGNGLAETTAVIDAQHANMKIVGGGGMQIDTADLPVGARDGVLVQTPYLILIFP